MAGDKRLSLANLRLLAGNRRLSAATPLLYLFLVRHWILWALVRIGPNKAFLTGTRPHTLL